MRLPNARTGEGQVRGCLMQAKIYLDVQFLTEWVLNLCVMLLTEMCIRDRYRVSQT